MRTRSAAAFILLLTVCLLATGCGQAPKAEVGAAWTRVGDPGGVFSIEGQRVIITDVCAGGPGLVAVGINSTDPELSGARPEEFRMSLEIWTSANGRDWTRLGPENFGGEEPVMLEGESSGKAIFGNTLYPRIASGLSGLVASASPDIWVSGDGVDWHRAAGDPASLPNGVVDIIAAGPGYIAAGSVADPADPKEPVTRFWSSPDGDDWTMLPPNEEAFRGYEVNALCAGGPGLVAVGEASLPSGSVTGFEEGVPINEGEPAQVWTSSNGGVAWTRLPQDDVVFGGGGRYRMTGIAAGGPGLAAVGSVDSMSFQGLAWASMDGLAWTKVVLEEGASPFQRLRAVNTGGPGFVVVGAVENVDTDSGPLYKAAAWTSPDGIAWTASSFTGGTGGGNAVRAQYLYSVASFEGGLVAVGAEDVRDYPGRNRGMVWVSLK